MKTLQASKEFYLANQGKPVRLTYRGRAITATCTKHETESRGGSWERGSRFYESQWAMLKRTVQKTKHYKPTMWSADHGKSWHLTVRDAMKSKGKLRLSNSSHGEFAFNSIQVINRQYDPGFQWRR